jgi:heme-degrading monooxygenase HmoA
MAVDARNDAYIARLWQYPSLCVAFFGVQFSTEEGQRRYVESGIHEEVSAALEGTIGEGLLLHRMLLSEEGLVLMQYWRSYEELDAWSQKLPHSRGWKWLAENVGLGVGFYHEIYQVKTGEAIFEKGTRPVGPAVFCDLQSVPSGQGKSKDRSKRFAEAQAVLSEVSIA